MRPAEARPARSGPTGVLFAASRDPDAKLTFVECRTDGNGVAVKLPTTEGAGGSVAREGRLLVGLRCLPLGRLATTIPRYVRSAELAGPTRAGVHRASRHADERRLPHLAAHRPAPVRRPGLRAGGRLAAGAASRRPPGWTGR